FERCLDDGPGDVDKYPVRCRVARIELGVQPLRPRRKAALNRLAWSSPAIARPALRHAYEGNHDLVREASFRAMGAELARRREQLDERRLLAAAEVVEQRFDAERVSEVGDQLVVRVGQDDPARQSCLVAPLAEGFGAVREALEIAQGGIPQSTGRPRRGGHAPDRTPVPRKDLARPLPLKLAKEAVDA